MSLWAATEFPCAVSKEQVSRQEPARLGLRIVLQMSLTTQISDITLYSMKYDAVDCPEATHQRFSNCQTHEKWNRASIPLDASVLEY